MTEFIAWSEPALLSKARQLENDDEKPLLELIRTNPPAHLESFVLGLSGLRRTDVPPAERAGRAVVKYFGPESPEVGALAGAWEAVHNERSLILGRASLENLGLTGYTS